MFKMAIVGDRFSFEIAFDFEVEGENAGDDEVGMKHVVAG